MPTLGATRRAKVKRRKKSAALVAARPIRPGATPAAGIFVLPFTRRGMSWIGTGGRQMKKVTLYSRSTRVREPSAPRPRAGLPRVAAAEVPPQTPAAPLRRSRFRTAIARYERALLVVAGALFALALVWVHAANSPAPAPLTLEELDAAVL
jgi:hypothetical protein